MDTGTERRADHELRQAVENIQNRFLERVGDRVARGISLRELCEELIIEAMALSGADYGCVLHTHVLDADLQQPSHDAHGIDQRQWSLSLEAVVSLDPLGQSQRQHDALLMQKPERVVRSILQTGKGVFSNDVLPDEPGNLPGCHPAINNYAMLPIREDGQITSLLFVANADNRFDLATIKRLQSMLDAFVRVHINTIVNRGIHHVINEIARTSRQLVTLLDASLNAIVTINEREAVTAFNPAAELLFNRAATESLGVQAHELLSAEILDQTRESRQAFRRAGRHHEPRSEAMSQSTILRDDGGQMPVKLRLFHTAVDERLFTTFIVQDITEERLRRLAHHDPLTGFSNRTRFLEDLDTTLTSSAQHDDVALLTIDLDGFKAVNDTFGHDVGDALLQQVAHRLKRTAGSSDALARLGNDQFTIVLTELETRHSAGLMATRVASELRRAFIIDGQNVLITASIGIAVGQRHVTDCEALLKQADVALHHAKEAGRSRFVFFTPELEQIRQQRSALITSLRHAVDEQAFELYYQPQVLIHEQKLLGFEALLRWPQESGKPISPQDFIEVLEQTGLINDVGQWAIDEACRQYMVWRHAGLIDDVACMSVNVSPRQLGIPGFADEVATILGLHKMAPQSLVLEITESALVESIDSNIINDLKSLGVQISLDDFGTGYSSLAYLGRMPLDHLKIDRSFIIDINENSQSVTIVRTIIRLARSLGIKVITEGVEDAYVLPLLEAEGCEGYQGYYFSRPKPASEMTTFLSGMDDIFIAHHVNFVDLDDGRVPLTEL